MKKIFPILLSFLLSFPALIYAQDVPHFRSGVVAYQDQRDLGDIIQFFIDLLKLAMPILVGIAVLVFFKGLIQFIAKSGDAKTHEAGRSLMIWGVIALFIMVSVFGILRIFYSDLGFDNARWFGIPTLPTSGQSYP
jgi:hypothetical protein